MAAQNEIVAPEWVFPGAQVVVATRKHSVTVALVDTVKAVGKMWITLENEPVRIKVKNLESAHQGSTYAGSTVSIVEQYSEKGQRLLAETRVFRATNRVKRCIDAWKNNPRGETERGDLRDALDRLDTAIEKASE